MVTQPVLVLLCLFVVVDMTQDIADQKKVFFLRFLNSTYLCENKKKLALAPTVWNDLSDDVDSAPTLACFRKKAKILSLSKGLPTLSHTILGVSMVTTWLFLLNNDY